MNDYGETKQAFKYVPFQMDFKTPADHKIEFADGSKCEDRCLEIQISLSNLNEFTGNIENKTSAVLSLFYNEGKKSDSDAEGDETKGNDTEKKVDELDQLFGRNKGAEGEDAQSKEFDLAAFIGKFDVSKYQRYVSPHCKPAEIDWILVQTPRTMTKEQFDDIMSVYDGNAKGNMI